MEYDKNTIYFSIPDFFNNYKINMTLVKMMKNNPGWFRPNVKIDSMYGTFPGCIWNGGRGQFGQASIENIMGTVTSINNEGISLRYTFTNSLIDESLYEDYYCNLILQNTNTAKINGINVSSEGFAKYLEQMYPDYYLMWSTTKVIRSVEEVNELSKDRIVVPPYNMNNTTAIEELEHPENIELLCCEACIDNCPNRKNHYDSIARGQMFRSVEGFKCPHGCELYYYYELVPQRKHHISIDQINEIYLPLGFNKFKISGRNDNIINVIERYVNYFAKPEYRDTVRNHLLLDGLMTNNM